MIDYRVEAAAYWDRGPETVDAGTRIFEPFFWTAGAAAAAFLAARSLMCFPG